MYVSSRYNVDQNELIFTIYNSNTTTYLIKEELQYFLFILFPKLHIHLFTVILSIMIFHVFYTFTI